MQCSEHNNFELPSICLFYCNTIQDMMKGVHLDMIDNVEENIVDLLAYYINISTMSHTDTAQHE